MNCCTREEINRMSKNPSLKSEREHFHICPSKLSKRELEDLYFSLLQNNLELKKKINRQEEKIKVMSTRLQRMAAAQKGSVGSGKEQKDCCAATKAVVNEQKNAINDLKKTNERLSGRIKQLNMRLCSTKQFLGRNPTRSNSTRPISTSARPVSTKNASTSALKNDKSKIDVDVKSMDEKVVATKNVQTESPKLKSTLAGGESVTSNKLCDENRCRTLMEELKNKIVDLQEELSKTHDEYSTRISRLEDEVTKLREDNVRVRSESALKDQHAQQQVNDARQVRGKLRDAQAHADDLSLQLAIEKGKVAEMETQLKAASFTSDVSKALGEQFNPDVVSEGRPVNEVPVLDDKGKKSDDSGYVDPNISRDGDDEKASNPEAWREIPELKNREPEKILADLEMQLAKLQDMANSKNQPDPLQPADAKAVERPWSPEVSDFDPSTSQSAASADTNRKVKLITNGTGKDRNTEKDLETGMAKLNDRWDSYDMEKTNKWGVEETGVPKIKIEADKDKSSDSHNRYQIPGPIPTRELSGRTSTPAKKRKDLKVKDKKKPKEVQSDERDNRSFEQREPFQIGVNIGKMASKDDSKSLASEKRSHFEDENPNFESYPIREIKRMSGVSSIESTFFDGNTRKRERPSVTSAVITDLVEKKERDSTPSIFIPASLNSTSAPPNSIQVSPTSTAVALNSTPGASNSTPAAPNSIPVPLNRTLATPNSPPAASNSSPAAAEAKEGPGENSPDNVLDICEHHAHVCTCQRTSRRELAVFRTCSGTLRFRTTSAAGTRFRRCGCGQPGTGNPKPTPTRAIGVQANPQDSPQDDQLSKDTQFSTRPISVQFSNDQRWSDYQPPDLSSKIIQSSDQPPSSEQDAYQSRMPDQYPDQIEMPKRFTETNNMADQYIGPNETPEQYIGPNEMPDQYIGQNKTPDHYTIENNVPEQYTGRNKTPDQYIGPNTVPDQYIGPNKIPDQYIGQNKTPDQYTRENNLPEQYTGQNKMPDQYIEQNKLPDQYIEQNKLPNQYIGSNKLPDQYIGQNKTPEQYTRENNIPEQYTGQNTMPDHIEQNKLPDQHIEENEIRDQYIGQNNTPNQYAVQNKMPEQYSGQIKLPDQYTKPNKTAGLVTKPSKESRHYDDKTKSPDLANPSKISGQYLEENKPKTDQLQNAGPNTGQRKKSYQSPDQNKNVQYADYPKPVPSIEREPKELARTEKDWDIGNHPESNIQPDINATVEPTDNRREIRLSTNQKAYANKPTQRDRQCETASSSKPKTYILQGFAEVVKCSRSTSPDNTDKEISSMTDLPSERDDYPRPRERRSPGEDRATTTTTDSYTMPSVGSLSEGELPMGATNKRPSKEMLKADAADEYSTGAGGQMSSSQKMEQALKAIGEELARCRQLLVQTQRAESEAQPRKSSKDASSTADVERCPSVALRRAEARSRIGDAFSPSCMFTLHIGTVVLSDEAVINSRDVSLVLTWQFFDQSVSMTRMRAGRVVHFDFSTEYDVKLTDGFVDYMKYAEMSILICELNKEDQVFAKCSLPLRDALLHTNRRADMSLALMAGPRLLAARRPSASDPLDAGDEVGVLDLWCMLRAEPRLLPAINKAIAKGTTYAPARGDIRPSTAGPIMAQLNEDDMDLDEMRLPHLNASGSYERKPNTDFHNFFDQTSSTEATQLQRNSQKQGYEYTPPGSVYASQEMNSQHSAAPLTDTGSRDRPSLDKNTIPSDAVSPMHHRRSSGIIINEVPVNIKSTSEMKKALYTDNTNRFRRISDDLQSDRNQTFKKPFTHKKEKQRLSLSATPDKSNNTNNLYDTLSSTAWRRGTVTAPQVEPAKELSDASLRGKKYEDMGKIIATKKAMDAFKKVQIKKETGSVPELEYAGEQDRNKYSEYLDRIRSQILNITVLWLALNEECEAMGDPKVQRLYVAYSFLGHSGAELETPTSLPKPKHCAEKCFFNFKKSFKLSETELLQLGRMAKIRAPSKGPHNAGDCVLFTVVSEPLEDPLGLNSCEDIGYAYLYFGELLAYSAGSDTYTEVLPVQGRQDVCGVLAVKVDGLDVVRKCLTMSQADNWPGSF